MTIEQQAQFGEGDKVIFLSDRSKVGTVVTDPSLRQGSYWCRVRLPNGRIETVPEEDLEPFRAARDPENLFKRGALGDYDDFVRLVTFQKLDTPLDNTLYALRASRTDFYAHQYKPLIKFLRSTNQRLLIADEVGLGKTIEAGHVLVEQRARRAVRQVLVVCPAALRSKWREEMWRRFDEEFDILQGKDFRRLLRDVEERGALGEFKAIYSLQSLRMEQNLEMLQASPLPLDLLIVDEAHHLRNPWTNAHQVVRALADRAAAILFLTATPIHLGNENLFHLLHLLEPGEFEDFETFQDLLEANAPVVEARKLAFRGRPFPHEAILERVRSMGNGSYSEYFDDNPLYKRVERKVSQTSEWDRGAIAELQKDLEDLNLIGHVFTRTKKREVFEEPNERTARVKRPPMTGEETEFYNAVTEFVREAAAERSGTIQYFAIMAAQRQMASCMHAVKEKYRTRALKVTPGDLDDSDLEEYAEDGEEVLTPSERVVTAAHALGDVDTKYDELLETLERLQEVEPGRKVMLFSYYKGTLRYLKRRLTEDGFPCEVIHGDVPSNPDDPERDERGKRVRRFRDPDGVPLLLSSEVGSEGLDFQFCHVLINYDLPWNPMRVEQRIGRLDRLGQKSDRIIIINFSIPDTIEDKILRRLYHRIGIFERSVGDLESILGEKIQALQRQLLSTQLTPEEEERRIEQTARAIEMQKVELERLEQEAESFVGHDEYLETELRRIQEGGEFLRAGDCETFFRAFLEAFATESTLTPTRHSDVYRLQVGRDLETAIKRQPDNLAKRRFLRRLGSGDIEVTFDSDEASTLEDIEFLRAHHPLMQVATDYYRDHPEGLHPVSGMRLPQSEVAEAGQYFYALFSVTIEGGRTRRRLEPLYLRVNHDGSVEGAVDKHTGSLLMGECLQNGSGTVAGLPMEEEQSRSLLDSADDLFLNRMAKQRREMEERNEARVQQRLVSLEKTHTTRIENKRELLEHAQEKGYAERYIRMLEGTIRNMESDYEARRQELEGERDIHFSYSLVGCGLLEVAAA